MEISGVSGSLLDGNQHAATSQHVNTRASREAAGHRRVEFNNFRVALGHVPSDEVTVPVGQLHHLPAFQFDVVRVSSDYPRLPVVEVPLTGAMGKILQQRGDSVFLLDPKTGRLDMSFMNEVSWAGSRR